MLKEISKKQLLELKSILNQINDSDYSKNLMVLENGTIGRHVRHVLEFYECLFMSKSGDIVCYDDRKRNLLLEEKNFLIEKQKQIVEEKQQEILDSIYYARRIQTALITSEYYDAKQLSRLKVF